MNRTIKTHILGLIALILCTSQVSATVEDIAEGFLNVFTSVAKGLVNLALDIMTWTLTWNPKVSIVKPITDDFIQLLTPIYVIAFLISGFYFFFYSDSPRGRARAKSTILKLLISIAIVIAAPVIYQLLLDLSEIGVNFIIQSEPYTINATNALGIYSLGPLWLLITLIIILIMLLVQIMRYFVLLVIAAFFPMIIFLYFFDFTRSYGQKLMELTFAFIFAPVSQAFAIVFFLKTAQGMGPSLSPFGMLSTAILFLGALLLVIIAPLITMKLIKWIGALIVAAGFIGMANMRKHMPQFFFGNLAMGEGTGAITFAATMSFVHNLEHGSEHMGEAQIGFHSQYHIYTGELRGIKEYHVQTRAGKGLQTGVSNGTFTSRLLREADVYMEKGYSLQRKGKHTAAEKEFQKAAKIYEDIEPKFGSKPPKGVSRKAHAERLGRLYGKMGDAYREFDLNKAVDAYRKATQNDPTNPRYSMKLAETFFKRG